ncbi:MAG: hypothetical protein L0H70_04890, partial [Xanthomonadales bacterium]|nr:hypothetical protein [Xanthomonadales bacterium]
RHGAISQQTVFYVAGPAQAGADSRCHWSTTMIRLPLIATLLLGTVALRAHAAPAFCPPIPPPYPISVGDTTSDANCDFDSIQAAIDSLGTCPATIALSNEITYADQHIQITDKSITLLGLAAGVTCPGPTNNGLTHIVAFEPSSPVVTLDGGGEGGPVLSISGNSHVTLQYLIIQSGRSVDGRSGGGIVFDGSGALSLDTSTVANNFAGYNGGGIAMFAAGGHTDLSIGKRTSIYGNAAKNNGGGIYLNGDVHLTMVANQSAIYDNQALGATQPTQGYGGGIFMAGGRADIGAPGVPGCGQAFCPAHAALDENIANKGGGIYLTGGSQGDAVAVLFTTDPVRPTSFHHNIANAGTGHGGGAFWAQANYFYASNASLCLFNVNASDNLAPDGSIGEARDAGLFINADPEGVCDQAAIRALGALDCAPTGNCNTYSGNVANATDGTLLYTTGALAANRFALRNNDAGIGWAIYADNPTPPQALQLSAGGQPVRVGQCHRFQRDHAGARQPCHRRLHLRQQHAWRQLFLQAICRKRPNRAHDIASDALHRCRQRQRSECGHRHLPHRLAASRLQLPQRPDHGRQRQR